MISTGRTEGGIRQEVVWGKHATRGNKREQGSYFFLSVITLCYFHPASPLGFSLDVFTPSPIINPMMSVASFSFSSEPKCRSWNVSFTFCAFGRRILPLWCSCEDDSVDRRLNKCQIPFFCIVTNGKCRRVCHSLKAHKVTQVSFHYIFCCNRALREK